MKEFKTVLSNLVEVSIENRDLKETIEDQTVVIETQREDFESESKYMEEAFHTVILSKDKEIKRLNEELGKVFAVGKRGV